jgi:hypothetical protein
MCVRHLRSQRRGRSPFGAPRGISGPGPCSPLSGGPSRIVRRPHTPHGSSLPGVAGLANLPGTAANRIRGHHSLAPPCKNASRRRPSGNEAGPYIARPSIARKKNMRFVVDFFLRVILLARSEVIVMAGHSASKMRINALVSGPSTPFLRSERHKAGHDGELESALKFQAEGTPRCAKFPMRQTGRLERGIVWHLVDTRGPAPHKPGLPTGVRALPGVRVLRRGSVPSGKGGGL